jgi:RND superfamily putative drug exporter
MSNHQLHKGAPLVARTIHRFSLLIILAWLAIIVILSIGVPPLAQVEKEHSVSLNPTDAPSFKAAERMTEDFKDSDSSSSGTVAMIVLEGQQPLGDEAHRYYDRLIRQLQDDPKHVLHIQNFWGDELTRGAAESADGKAAYVQVFLSDIPGQALGTESVEAVQHILARTPAPPGV